MNKLSDLEKERLRNRAIDLRARAQELDELRSQDKSTRSGVAVGTNQPHDGPPGVFNENCPCDACYKIKMEKIAEDHFNSRAVTSGQQMQEQARRKKAYDQAPVLDRPPREHRGTRLAEIGERPPKRYRDEEPIERPWRKRQ